MPLPLLAGAGLFGLLAGGTAGAIANKNIDLVPGVGPNEPAREAERRALMQAEFDKNFVPYPARVNGGVGEGGHTTNNTTTVQDDWNGNGTGANGASSPAYDRNQVALYDQGINAMITKSNKSAPSRSCGLTVLAGGYIPLVLAKSWRF